LFTISPAVAAQITPSLAVGIAFNIWPKFLNNGWEQEVAVQGEGSVTVGLDFVPFVAQGRIREEFAFEGFNVTAGFLWSISSRVALGGVFRSPFTAKVTRTHSSTLTVTLEERDPVTTRLRFQETLDMDMPLAYGLGVSIHAMETNVTALRFALDVSRIHWSDFRLEASRRDDVLLVDNGAPAGKGRAVLNGEADDTTTVRLGVQYLWLPLQLAFRAGGFYDPEPGERGTDPFWGGSFGTGIVLKEKVVVDFAYTFRTGKVQSAATDTSVYQHEMSVSMIYYF
jgi:long-subunit fatty acid transport protein